MLLKWHLRQVLEQKIKQFLIYVLFQACLTNADPCTCFASVQIPAASTNCKPGHIQTGAKAILKSCKSAFSACSKGLKVAGAYVDQCTKCDCITTSTVAPGRFRRELLNIKWQ